MNRLRSPLIAAAIFITSVASADWVENSIQGIRSKYNQIQNWSLKSNQIEFQAEDDPAGGTLTRYTYNSETVKINLSYSLGDHGGVDQTYCYENGNLFFIHVIENYWGFTGRTLANGQSETEDNQTEHRLYFSNGQLIRHLRKEVASTDPELLSKLASDAANQPYSDPALSNRVYSRGQQAMQVSSPEGLGTLLMTP